MNPSANAARVGPAYVSGGQVPPSPGFPPAPRPSLESSPMPVASNGPATRNSPGTTPGGLPGTTPGAGRTICPKCGNTTTPGLPFCAHCGTRVGSRVSVEISSLQAPRPGSTQALGAGRPNAGPRLALLGDSGEPTSYYTLDHGEALIGRAEADISFAEDNFMSPIHARLEVRAGQLCLRDLGSRNGSWLFIDQPCKLSDCDLLLIGSQFIRFRRLGYPGPHPPEADATRRMGSSVPTVDIAVLEQLRADGSVRDVFHLSPGRSIEIGRETGDWIFPYDVTMSGRHAEIRSEDSEFFVHDANSRNGVATAVRGERTVHRGQRILLGDQILRVESV